MPAFAVVPEGEGDEGGLPHLPGQWHAVLQLLHYLLREAPGCLPSYPARCIQRWMNGRAVGQPGNKLGTTPCQAGPGNWWVRGTLPSHANRWVPLRLGIPRHAPPREPFLPNLMVTFGVGLGLSHVAVWQKDQDLTRPDTDLTLGPSAAMCPVGY